MKKLVALASVLVLGGSLAVAALVENSAPSFASARSYAIGVRPHSVAIGDLNGDGKPDLATDNRLGHSASVLLNRGDGSFEAKRDYRTGESSWSVAIGDLNGDGRLDLAVANLSASTVSVLLNRSDGSFQAKRDYAVADGPFSVAIGDLNGDAKPDLATANQHGVGVSVLINTPGLCAVQNVSGKTLPAARTTIARGNCRIGRVRRAYSKAVKRGRVISQHPNFGAVLSGGSKVDVVVSRGAAS